MGANDPWLCEGGDSLAQISFGTRNSKYRKKSLLKTKPPLLRSSCYKLACLIF